MTDASTERYSKRSGDEIRSAVVRFWYPQSAKTGAQKPVSQNRRYELTVGAGHSEADPLTGMLRYNKDSVHGDMYVWLMPNRTNAAVSYVIFVREERLQ